MDRDRRWTRIGNYVARVTPGLSRRSALLILGVLAAVFLWVIAVAPEAVAFVLAVGLAAAWCAWLERHAEGPRDADRSTKAVSSFGTPQSAFDTDGPVAITSRDLTGTREAKLAQLDSFMTQLHAARLALEGRMVRRRRI